MELAARAPEVAGGLLVEADLLSKPLGIESPAFDVGVVTERAMERVKPRQFLRDVNRKVWPGHACGILGGLVVEHVMGRVVIGENPDLAGPRSVWCARDVLRGA